VGVRLQRHLGALRGLEAGMWLADPGWPSLVEQSIFVSCPGCGGIHKISDTHSIAINGRIAPIFSCPTVTCSFQSFLELEAYGEEVIQ
jgi:hypothetical protein